MLKRPDLLYGNSIFQNIYFVRVFLTLYIKIFTGNCMKNLIDELKWRGLIQDIMPGTEEQLCREPTAGYVGFDPTADSLHIGSLIPIIVLMHLQRFGHKPIALVGGATGMVGDPSGKSEERNLLSKDVLNHNVAAVKKQLEKFIDFNSINEN